jgi:hypothetical protein
MPVRIQEADGRRFIHNVGGSYRRIGRDYLRPYWRAQRRRARMMLHSGGEPDPTLPRHGEKWMYW